MSDSAVLIASERRETSRRALRYLSHPENRDRLKRLGVTASMPTVPVEWDTPVSEVRGLLRVQDGRDKVTILIRKGEDFCVLLATTSTPIADDFIRDSDISPQSPIGLVYDTLTPKGWDITHVEAKSHHLGAFNLVVPAL